MRKNIRHFEKKTIKSWIDNNEWSAVIVGRKWTRVFTEVTYSSEVFELFLQLLYLKVITIQLSSKLLNNIFFFV